MSVKNLWVGLDLGFGATHVCIINDAGAALHEETCETRLEPLQAVLAPRRERIGLIAVEAGSDTHIVRKLRDEGFPVALFEARKASKFLTVRRNKTDAGDARGLADLARLGRETVSQVHLKSIECQRIRAQLVMRHKLVRFRVAADGALRSCLATYGKSCEFSRIPRLTRERVRGILLEINNQEGLDLSKDLYPLIEVCENLRLYLRELDRTLSRQAAAHPVCSRLMKVAGVGPICSLSFYSAIEDPSRFERTSDVGAYLGLVPRRHQSGNRSGTRGITKTGSKLTRTHLVNSATVFGSRGPDSALKDWVTSLKSRIGSRRAHVALARKLAILLLILWKNECGFEPYPSRGAPH